MGEIVVKSEAKINLSLDITGIRDDGYHEILTIIQSIPLYDMITIKTTKSDKPNITLTCNKESLPTDSKNLAYKAADLLISKCGINDDISIKINKRIPVGGGLGGGSSNAAAVLNGLNKLYKLGYTKDELATMSKPLGSDIPALVQGGCVLARGTGTEVSSLPALTKGYLLLVNPNVFISTERIYKLYDEMDIPESAHPNTDLLIKAIEKGDLYTFAKNMKNVLEYPVLSNKSKINRLKIELSSTDCLGAMMSGSGSSVFALYDNVKKAYRSLDHFRKQHYFAVLINL